MFFQQIKKCLVNIERFDYSPKMGKQVQWLLNILALSSNFLILLS